MLHVLHSEEASPEDWLAAYWTDFRRRFISLLSYQFSKFTPALALSVLTNKSRVIKSRSEYKAKITGVYDKECDFQI